MASSNSAAFRSHRNNKMEMDGVRDARQLDTNASKLYGSHQVHYNIKLSSAKTITADTADSIADFMKKAKFHHTSEQLSSYTT